MLRPLARAISSLFRASPQLQLSLDPPPSPPRTADELLAVLRAHGLVGIGRCELTRNRSVMVSYRGGRLRVHEAFLEAPAETLRAVSAFVSSPSRAARRAAQATILAHPVPPSARAPARVERTRPEDEPMAARLREWHQRYNDEHFGGALRPLDLRVSRRMKRRLGHYSVAGPLAPSAIVLGRAHVRRDGWTEALHTLLHEMVHQWQDESGLSVDHGPVFRRKAREVGVIPRAKRALSR